MHATLFSVTCTTCEARTTSNTKELCLSLYAHVSWNHACVQEMGKWSYTCSARVISAIVCKSSLLTVCLLRQLKLSAKGVYIISVYIHLMKYSNMQFYIAVKLKYLSRRQPFLVASLTCYAFKCGKPLMGMWIKWSNQQCKYNDFHFYRQAELTVQVEVHNTFWNEVLHHEVALFSIENGTYSPQSQLRNLQVTGSCCTPTTIHWPWPLCDLLPVCCWPYAMVLCKW